MGFKPLQTSAVAIGKATSQLLWLLCRNNFVSHQARILVLEASSTFLPAGSTFLYGGSTAPAGFLTCDGSTVSRTTYANLFAIIGTTFNTGGEAGTDFRLPDSRGKVVIGNGTGSGLTARTIAAVGGAETQTLSAGEMATHSHGITDPGHTHKLPEECNTTPSGGAQILMGDRSFGGVATIGNGFTTGSSSVGALSLVNAGSGGSHNNVQPFLALNYVIKT